MIPVVFKQGQLLRTDADLDHAVWFAVLVEVWRDGKRIEEAGPVQMYDEKRVHIHNGYYPRSVYEFRVG